MDTKHAPTLPSRISLTGFADSEIWVQDWHKPKRMLAEIVRDEDDPPTDEEYLAFANALMARYNSHDALVSALKRALADCEDANDGGQRDYDWVGEAQAALRATGVDL